MVLFLFMLVEVSNNEDSRFVADVVLGGLLSIDSLLRLLRQHASNGFARFTSVSQMLALLLFWILFFAAHDGSGIVKPLVVSTACVAQF